MREASNRYTPAFTANLNAPFVSQAVELIIDESAANKITVDDSAGVLFSTNTFPYRTGVLTWAKPVSAKNNIAAIMVNGINKCFAALFERKFI